MSDGLRDLAKTIHARCRWFCDDPVRRFELETWCERLLDGSANRERTVTLVIELMLDCRKREARHLTSRLAWAVFGDGWPGKVEEIRRGIQERRRLCTK